MKTIFNYITMLMVLLFASTSYASSSADLAKVLNNVTSMQADFVQSTYDNHSKLVQQSFGQMALERPGKFRWQVKKPIPQLIIANDTRLWIYDPDLEQVTIRVLHKASGEAPALLLTHTDTSLDSEFTITTMPAPDGWQWYKLVPKQADNMFASVAMGFRDKQIAEMHLEDSLGHKTVIRFNNTKTNATLPATLFIFKPPANVDIIDETKTKK